MTKREREGERESSFVGIRLLFCVFGRKARTRVNSGGVSSMKSSDNGQELMDKQCTKLADRVESSHSKRTKQRQRESRFVQRLDSSAATARFLLAQPQQEILQHTMVS